MTNLEILEKCTDRLTEILIELKNVTGLLTSTWQRMHPYDDEGKNDRR